MASTIDWSARLRRLDADDWASTLEGASELPGPRANLDLVVAAARIAGASEIDALVRAGGEFATMCAAAAIGRDAGAPDSEKRARRLAQDPRWRVREGVVIGLQLWGDVDPAAMAELVAAWATAASPLVRRAAVAAICEPRLLRSSSAAARAVEICRQATDTLRALPTPGRRDPDVRTLRQCLGYAWSVAVAADPAPGLRAFHALSSDDPDVAWIIRENRRKKRLLSLEAVTPHQEQE
ncbi:hypothetical protein HMPREF1529_02419 [Microbacterium sp. oral taxon 186 str. F0373]|uniref:HEAT repeat domain-containing protein n=1 Tax=Microbacterium sp. oral taxon 186 TaxID=712383 RepID=UPI00034EC416|nr:HEAT repeat domain-containing protein [Microbacterium sp. oral taxon 186]EPD83052.1 hypothetical protein HMPREF1529_02419 [Microbacterium sp. oral taxon 186 str. F0373]